VEEASAQPSPPNGEPAGKPAPGEGAAPGAMPSPTAQGVAAKPPRPMLNAVMLQEWDV
jgi:hypothetical protein